MRNLYLFFFSIIMLLPAFGCSDDNSADNLSEVAGTWYGTYKYYNPASGTKYQYLTLRLETNGTGELECETPVSFFYAKFAWSLSGNQIICKGVSGSTNDDMANPFNWTAIVSGNEIHPVDQFSVFTLTRDNSIISGDDDPNNDQTSEPSQGNTDTSELQNLKKMARENVEIVAKYSNYCWKIECTSTLHKHLDENRFSFGIGYGEIGDVEHLTCGNQNYSYSVKTSGDKKIYTITQPFFY